ncbi:MAG TPA: hypothetical protein VIP98_08815 [Microlunatus sp.]
MTAEAQHTDSDPRARAEPQIAIREDRTERLRDVLVLLLLAVTAVITAWCGFEASKWGGEMSIAFSEASSNRIAAARAQDTANSRRQIDVNLWAIYIQAKAEGKPQLARYVQSRFPDRLEVAYEAWLAQGKSTNSPFDLKAYQPPGQAQAAAADHRADQRFADALQNNARGDRYTLLTVLFALVLFFAAVSVRPPKPAAQWMLLVLGLVGFVVGLIAMLQLPVIV